MKKIFNFVTKAFMTLQALVAVSAMVFTQFMDIEGYTDELIIGLLTLIVIDFFVFAVGYLEEIATHIKDIYKLLDKKGARVDFVKRNEFDMLECINAARHDIFISGTTLTNLVGKKDLFCSVPSSVNINFLLMDLENQEVLNAFRKMRYNSNDGIHTNQRYINQGNMFKDLYHALKNKPNIHFAVSDRIMPITFIAVDIEKITSSTMIKVQHYLYEKEADQATVSYIVRPGNEMFDLFKEEIQILWDKSIKEKERLYLEKE